MKYRWLWYTGLLSVISIHTSNSELSSPSSYYNTNDIFSFVHSPIAHLNNDDLPESTYQKVLTNIIQSETFITTLSTLCALNRHIEKRIDIAASGQKIKGIAAAAWSETIRQTGWITGYFSSSPKTATTLKEQRAAEQYCLELYMIVTKEVSVTQSIESLGTLLGVVDTILCDTFTCNKRLDMFLALFIQQVMYPLAEQNLEKLQPPSAEEEPTNTSCTLEYLCLVLATLKLRIDAHEKRYALPQTARLLEKDIMRLSIEKQEPLTAKELIVLVKNLCE